MTIYSLIAKRIEDGGWSGVCRFDYMLRRVFPEFRSITPTCMPRSFESDDFVIADNHLSLLAPDSIKTVVVHHGCAGTHYARDPQWRNDSTRLIVEQQEKMFEKPNRKHVAPSAWVAQEFRKRQPMHDYLVIPHWVDRIERAQPSGAKPLIIGDWRDFNKGADIWRKLAARCPQWDFLPIAFKDEAGKRWLYGQAALFLNLSLCEGASYAMADAEAAGLPIVTTDTGLYQEFSESTVISYHDSGNLMLLENEIARRLAGHRGPSFYDAYTFENWAAAWRSALQ